MSTLLTSTLLLRTTSSNNPCYSNPCIRGTCFIDWANRDYFCKCPYNFFGKHCEYFDFASTPTTRRNACYPNPCIRGTCYCDINKLLACPRSSSSKLGPNTKPDYYLEKILCRIIAREPGDGVPSVHTKLYVWRGASVYCSRPLESNSAEFRCCWTLSSFFFAPKHPHPWW